MPHTDMNETESHFPWIKPLRNQLKRLSFGCTFEEYKKVLKKFESSVSTEVKKLKEKPKPKRATKFSRILKNLIGNLKAVQFVSGLKNDESILSAYGLIVVHYVNLIQSSSLLDRKSAGDIANTLYSFIQIVLEQSWEYVLDTILAVGPVDGEMSSLIVKLLKNILDDKSHYRHDSRTFVKFLIVLKLLMERKLAEKKIRKILLQTTYPKDLSLYLLEKLRIKLKSEDVDFVFVLSKLKPEVIVEECKSRLSVIGLEPVQDYDKIRMELLDSSSLFFIDVGGSDGVGSEMCSKIEINTSAGSDPELERENCSTSSVPEVETQSGSESEDELDNALRTSVSTLNQGEQVETSQFGFEAPINENDNLSEAASDLDRSKHEDDASDSDVETGQTSNTDSHFSVSKTFSSGDGVDYDESHENLVVTDPESHQSDEEIPLLDLDSDFDESFNMIKMNTSTNSTDESHSHRAESESLQQGERKAEMDLELPPIEGNSGDESTNSDDTVQLNINKVRKMTNGHKMEDVNEDLESDSESNRFNEFDDNSVSSTDTVEMVNQASTRSRTKSPTSVSPELKKTVSTSETDSKDKLLAMSETAEPKVAIDGISPRQTRAGSRIGLRATVQQQLASDANQTFERKTRKRGVKQSQSQGPKVTRAGGRRTPAAKPEPERLDSITPVSGKEDEQDQAHSTTKTSNEDELKECSVAIETYSVRTRSSKTVLAQRKRSPVKSTEAQDKAGDKSDNDSDNLRSRSARTRNRKSLVTRQSTHTISASTSSPKSTEQGRKKSDSPPMTPSRMTTRASHAPTIAATVTPSSKALPVARTRRASTPRSTQIANKKAKVEEMEKNAVINESSEEESDLHTSERQTKVEVATKSKSASTGEPVRYNLRRRSVYKN